MSRLSEREKLRRIKWVLSCLNARITEKGFNHCTELGGGAYCPLCGMIRREAAEYYHLSDDLQEIC